MSDDPTTWGKRILIEASRLGARLFRRNIGMGWIGNAKKFTDPQTIHVFAGDVLIRNARPFHNGIVGQYDTYGWNEVLITPDMVGQRIAIHIEIEAKTGTGRETQEQVAWGEAVRRAGGRAGVARDLADVKRIVNGL